MLSNLRFHRRPPSNTASPVPDSSSWSSSALQLAQPGTFDSLPVVSPDKRPKSATTTTASAVPPSQVRVQSRRSGSRDSSSQLPRDPPSLPPIARVTSNGSDFSFSPVDYVASNPPTRFPPQPPQPSQPSRQPRTSQSPQSPGDVIGFLGGAALRNHMSPQENSPHSIAENTSNSASQLTVNKPLNRSQTAQAWSHNSPADTRAIGGSVGKRRSGARMMSDPQIGPPSAVLSPPTPEPIKEVIKEPTKSKKGLPFLKNPVSTLLARRKTNQNVPDLSLPLRNYEEKSPSYQPIRGTRIHDFSAPRPKKNTLGKNSLISRPIVDKFSSMPQPPAPIEQARSPDFPAPPVPPKDSPRNPSQTVVLESKPDVMPEITKQQDNATESGSREIPTKVSKPSLISLADIPIPPIPQDPPDDSLRVKRSQVVSIAASYKTVDLFPDLSPSLPSPHSPFKSPLGSPLGLSEDNNPAEDASKSTEPSAVSEPLGDATSKRGSVISDMSRKQSGVSGKAGHSSMPKHMKSTSSRFSFDMLGAANAEKQLEERHRQKEQDKKTSPAPDRPDSRYDDFDEDGFDYDAMDYDDGLEEAIPGVNCDYDEDDGFDPPLDEDQDPDNDQDNFAGFHFQRSEPASEVVSPENSGVFPPSEDNQSNWLDSATTQDTEIFTPLTEIKPTPLDASAGLGIQGLDGALQPPKSEVETAVSKQGKAAAAKPLSKDDELYFGGGHEFEGEGDGQPIDESIFDLDDTDQYGRPIPGMFATVLAERTASQGKKKRESDDMASRASRESDSVPQSTAHTSLSMGMQPKPIASEALGDESSLPSIPTVALEDDSIEVYQAALVAATNKAVTMGKLRRGSATSPPLPSTDLTVTSPTTSDSDQPKQVINSIETQAYDEYDNYDDDFSNGLDDFSNRLDDYELDDDPIIAEANASALANDSEGFYGQEFGFYSNSSAQQAYHTPKKSKDDQDNFQYASGGYFGPSGVTRTKSGHVVSREPNLTPITERSEYSNRNSIMSLALPTNGSRDGPLNSPGLAQLAIMAEDDNITLSSLLRLRSKAWGGSQVSLQSSREGSPSDRQGASSPLGPDREFLSVNTGHVRKNSSFSVFSQDSGAGSVSGSPTLTMSMAVAGAAGGGGAVPNQAVPPLYGLSGSSGNNTATSPNPSLFSLPPVSTTSSFPPLLEDQEMDSGHFPSTPSPTLFRRISSPSAALPLDSPAGLLSSPIFPSSNAGKPPPPQRRPNQERRDSISYTKEVDSWVLERRRTAESGEIEVLAREVVEGGKI